MPNNNPLDGELNSSLNVQVYSDKDHELDSVMQKIHHENREQSFRRLIN